MHAQWNSLLRNAVHVLTWCIMLFILCTYLQSVYHPTYALCDTPFDIYRLLHVSTPRCHPQGVIMTKVLVLMIYWLHLNITEQFAVLITHHIIYFYIHLTVTTFRSACTLDFFLIFRHFIVLTPRNFWNAMWRTLPCNCFVLYFETFAAHRQHIFRFTMSNYIWYSINIQLMTTSRFFFFFFFLFFFLLLFFFFFFFSSSSSINRGCNILHSCVFILVCHFVTVGHFVYNQPLV